MHSNMPSKKTDTRIANTQKNEFVTGWVIDDRLVSVFSAAPLFSAAAAIELKKTCASGWQSWWARCVPGEASLSSCVWYPTRSIGDLEKVSVGISAETATRFVLFCLLSFSMLCVCAWPGGWESNWECIWTRSLPFAGVTQPAKPPRRLFRRRHRRSSSLLIEPSTPQRNWKTHWAHGDAADILSVALSCVWERGLFDALLADAVKTYTRGLNYYFELFRFIWPTLCVSN